jgi:hypothetical protein
LQTIFLHRRQRCTARQYAQLHITQLAQQSAQPTADSARAYDANACHIGTPNFKKFSDFRPQNLLKQL